MVVSQLQIPDGCAAWTWPIVPTFIAMIALPDQTTIYGKSFEAQQVGDKRVHVLRSLRWNNHQVSGLDLLSIREPPSNVRLVQIEQRAGHRGPRREVGQVRADLPLSRRAVDRVAGSAGAGRDQLL